MKILAAISALVFSATAALGSTISLDFGSGFTQQTSNYGLGGNWSAGFNLSATTQETLWPNGVATLDRVSTNGTGHTTNVNSLTVTRENGGVFGLKSLNISSWMTNWGVEWLGVDAADKIHQSIKPLVWNVVNLTGITAAGKLVASTLKPYNQTTYLESRSFGINDWSNPDPIFRVGGFNNLTSLTLSGNRVLTDLDMGICDKTSLSFIDPIFKTTGYCRGSSKLTGPLQTLLVDPLEGVRNDDAYYDLAGLNLTVSAVPLPATAWLFLSALFALGWLRWSGHLRERGYAAKAC